MINSAVQKEVEKKSIIQNMYICTCVCVPVSVFMSAINHAPNQCQLSIIQ